MKRLMLSLLFVTASLPGIANAAERMPPDVRMTVPYSEQRTRREAYQQTPAEHKTWDNTRPLPASWLEAGLLEDAELMLIDYILDGGSQVYYFKDSVDRYFVFRRETPMRGEGPVDAEGKRSVIWTPRERLRFFIGDPMIVRSQAVEVPIGSACDQFLISVITEAAKRQPPLPAAPRDENWETFNRDSVQLVRKLTPEQSAKLSGFTPSVYLLEDTPVEMAKLFPTDELIRRLLGGPNPLRKGQPLTAVVTIPLNQADDVVRLEGYTFPADFYFTHHTKAETRVFGSNLYALFIGRIAPIHDNSIGTKCSINNPGYQYAPVTEGYHMNDVTSSGSGRRLR